MERKNRDYIRQDKRNPKLFKFSIGSIGTTRDVILKEFETHVEAKIWFEQYLKMARREMKKENLEN